LATGVGTRLSTTPALGPETPKAGATMPLPRRLFVEPSPDSPRPPFQTGGTGEYSLVCPYCDCEQTHVQKMVAHCRTEDGPTTTVEVDLTTGGVRRLLARSNPSGRRNAVTLEVSCEFGHDFEVALAQHKGDTLVTTALIAAIQ
jgi:hypothetical protein